MAGNHFFLGNNDTMALITANTMPDEYFMV